MNPKTTLNKKLYFTLLFASLLSVFAVFPYAVTLQRDLLESVPLPLPIVLLISFLQSALLLALTLWIGLKLAPKVGFKISLLEKALAKEKIHIKPILKPSILLGIFAGLAIIGLDALFIQFGVQLGKGLEVAIWKGLLASFYGAIAEEILLRLFLMSLIVWLLNKLFKLNKNAIDRPRLIWTAIILAALIFGLGHLPATATLTTLTPLVVMRALALNGIGGLVFGWLYWKKGLESAMLAHYSTDIVLHVVFPFFLTFVF